MDNISTTLTPNIPELKVLDGQNSSFLQTLLGLLYVVITLSTIGGNALVLHIFRKSKRRLRSPTHCLIANLAIADLLVGVLVMPVLTTVSLNNFKWYWGDLLCQGREHIHFCLCAASILSMMTIGIERYIGIRFPLRHKHILSRKRLAKVIMLIWILALVLTTMPLMLWPIPRDFIQPDDCPVNLTPNFVFFISVTVYFIPVSITAVLYYLIYRNAVRLYVPSPGKCYNVQSTQYSSPTSAVSYVSKKSNQSASKSDEDRSLETRNKQTVLAKKLGYIVGLMLLMYGPLFTVFFIIGFYPPVVSLNLLLTVAWLRYFSSCVNPYLYILVVPGFKKAFLKVILNEKSKLNKSSASSSDASSSNRSSDRRFIDEYRDSDYRNPPFKNTRSTEEWSRTKSNNEKSTLVPGRSIMSSRYCSFCGIRMPCREGERQGWICSDCDNQPRTTSTATDMLAKKLSLILEPEPEPKKQSMMQNSTAGEMSSDELVTEIHGFLKMMNESSSFKNNSDEAIRKRASGLLNSLINHPARVTFQQTDQHLIDNLRTSAMIPVVRKGSIMPNSSIALVEMDQLAVQELELDEIIKLLERTI